MVHTSKAFTTMVANRLDVIAHEDCDVIAAPWLVPFVATACAQAKDRYDPKKPGEPRLMLGNAVRMLCRAPKSRAGCHFAAAVGLANLIEGKLPQISGYAKDVHTTDGKTHGSRPRSLPRRRGHPDPRSDRRRSLRGRSLPPVADPIRTAASRTGLVGGSPQRRPFPSRGYPPYPRRLPGRWRRNGAATNVAFDTAPAGRNASSR